jgi:hypothetical protein
MNDTGHHLSEKLSFKQNKIWFFIKKSLDSIHIIKHRKLLIAMLCNDK